MAASPRTRFFRPIANRVINPVMRRFAGRLPGFGILTHTGRKTGSAHRTPVNVFEHGARFTFALTYGSEVHWVQNVLAAGHCELRTRGQDIHLVDPELVVDPTRRFVPPPVRVVLGLLNVTEFLRMRRA